MLKKIVIASLMLFLVSPISIHAQTFSTTQRIELLLQINTLLAQIQELQQQLIEIRQTNSESDDRDEENNEREFSSIHSDEIYETFYFTDDFESIYKNNDGELVRIDKNLSNRVIDLVLWDMWVEVVGEENSNHYIDEFRVVDESSTSIGAFIELKPGSDEWILGVNRDDYDRYQRSSQESYQEIFIHEYGHIVAYYADELREEFADEFWDREDYEHSERLDDLNGRARQREMDEYFEDNIDDFISDYATTNPDEDLAETFVEFVLKGRPTGNEEVFEKMRFLYRYELLVEAREEIRENLDL